MRGGQGYANAGELPRDKGLGVVREYRAHLEGRGVGIDLVADIVDHAGNGERRVAADADGHSYRDSSVAK